MPRAKSSAEIVDAMRDARLPFFRKPIMPPVNTRLKNILVKTVRTMG
jgi:hypothetical protein